MCMKKHDQLLVEELKNGKEKTLKSFYEEYFALFVSFANNLLPSEEECKDVVHDVFLKYWNTRNDFDNLIAIRAFFYKSIRNTCLNLIRHQQVQNKYLAENLQYLESESFIHETVVKEEIFHVIQKSATSRKWSKKYYCSRWRKNQTKKSLKSWELPSLP